MMKYLIGLAIASLSLSACATIPNDAPLGSEANPVRANMPVGQRAYLDRLRCSDGSAPDYERVGNYGSGPYGSIIDGYQVDCGDSAPGEVLIFMDMYHRHVENEAVPGFTITPVSGRNSPA